MRRIFAGIVSLAILAGAAIAHVSLPWPGPGIVASSGSCVTTPIILTSGTSFTNTTGCTNFTVETIGAGAGGGSGVASTSSGGGGAGGTYSKQTGITLSASLTVTYAIGAGGTSGAAGGDTYFCNSASNCASISGTAVQVGAKGGGAASGRTGGVSSTTGSVGSTKTAGGNGGTSLSGSGGAGSGGGSAAGPSGIGGAGASQAAVGLGVGGGGADNGAAGGVSSGSNSGAGGNSGPGGLGGASVTTGAGNAGANGGGGGGGGASLTAPGGVGGAGTEFDATHGSGGGAGGPGFTGTPLNTGANGGLYGGAGSGGEAQGASISNGGAGAQGIIVITPTTSGGACSQYTAFAARTSGMASPVPAAMQTLICGMVTDGTFALADVIYVPATTVVGDSLLNLVSTSFNGTNTVAVGNDFTTKQGLSEFTSDFISTGFNPTTAPSPNYTQNSASLFVWQVSANYTSGNISGFAFGDNGATPVISILPHYSDNNMYFRANCNTQFQATPAANVQWYGWVRNGSTSGSVVGYAGATTPTLSGGCASSALNNGVIIEGNNVSPSGAFADDSGQSNMGFLWIGGALTGTQQTNLQSRVHTYLQTVAGIP